MLQYIDISLSYLSAIARAKLRTGLLKPNHLSHN